MAHSSHAASRPATAGPGPADTSDDEVILVDAADRACGTAPKLDAHRQGLTHRAISVIVHDGAGRLLLQRRAAGKYHSAGLWTNTCCSHPRPGESVAAAAARRLAEEMGVIVPLTHLLTMDYRADVSNDLIEDEIVHLFGGEFSGTPVPDADEVSDWRWLDAEAVGREVDAHPERFTVWFRKFRHEHWGLIVGLASRGAARRASADAPQRET